MEFADPQFANNSSLEDSDDIDKLIEEMRKRVTEVIETIQSFQFNDATTWPKLLEQFNILSVQYQSLQNAISDHFQYSVLKPQTPNPEIPELLSSMLLPEMYKLQDSLINRLNSKFQGGPQRKIGEYQSIIREQEHMCTELEQQFSQLCTEMRMGQKIRANFGNNKQKVDNNIRNGLLSAIFQGNGLKHSSIDEYKNKQQEKFTTDFPSSSTTSNYIDQKPEKSSTLTRSRIREQKDASLPSTPATTMTTKTTAKPSTFNSSTSTPASTPSAAAAANTNRSSTPLQKPGTSSPTMMSQTTPPQQPPTGTSIPQQRYNTTTSMASAGSHQQQPTAGTHSLAPSAGSPVSSQRAPSPANRSNTPVGTNRGTPSPLPVHSNSPSPVNTPSHANVAAPPPPPGPANGMMHRMQPSPSPMTMRFAQNGAYLPMMHPYGRGYPMQHPQYAINQQQRMRTRPQQQYPQPQPQPPQQNQSQQQQQQQQQPPGSGRGQ